jgi:CheY-like chemotaxis protein
MKTILIVENNQSMRQMLTMALEDAGYRLLTARDGREALVSLQQRNPHLVLSDLVLPVLNGCDLYTTMQQHPVYRTIPFVGMSWQSSAACHEPAMVPDTVMLQPFDLPGLLTTINARIGEGHE